MLFKALYLFYLLTGIVLGLYDKGSNVIDLKATNFDQLVIKGDEIWIVEFYAPWCGHCKQLVPEYNKVANALKGVVKVGAINADEHQSIGGRYSVSGFPTIKIFGDNKNKPEDYNGGRTASDIVNAAINAIKIKAKSILGGGSSSGGGRDSNDVVELTDNNFDSKVLNSTDMWLVEFFAPWCGHCKNLEPHWAKAATHLKDKVKVGALDATVHNLKAQAYGIKGFPTIKFFPSGKKTETSAVDYDGGRTADDIINWALERFVEDLPAPEILEVTNKEMFAEDCTSKPLCIIIVLPHILDCQSECRTKYLNVLIEVADKYKQKLWGWVWTEASSQTKLEESLDIGGFGYPAMAVVNSKKMKFSVLRGSFSKEGINEFLRDLSYGRGNTAPVKGGELPKIFKTEPWDGKDGVLPQEEEIDLSDVNLDEKDEL